MRHLFQALIAILLLSLGNLSYAQCDGVVPLLCDADGDRDVDSDDIAAIGAANGEIVEPGDIRDIDGDGVITGLDSRQCVARCTEGLCDVPNDQEIGDLIDFSGPPELTPALFADLPKDPDTGMPILIEDEDLMLLIDLDRRDPVSGMAGCQSWIGACLNHSEGRSLDDCVRSVPRCETDQPWLENGYCCPEGCYDQYRVHRLGGAEPVIVLYEVFVSDGSCYPGYESNGGDSES